MLERTLLIRRFLLSIATALLLICPLGCERVEKAVDTYKKVKEMKSSDELKKGIADKTEGYKERIRRKVGMSEGKSRELQDDTNGAREQEK